MQHTLGAADFEWAATKTDCYSCADISILCRDAAMASFEGRKTLTKNMKIPPITPEDIKKAVKRSSPTVSQQLISRYEAFKKTDK